MKLAAMTENKPHPQNSMEMQRTIYVILDNTSPLYQLSYLSASSHQTVIVGEINVEINGQAEQKPNSQRMVYIGKALGNIIYIIGASCEHQENAEQRYSAIYHLGSLYQHGQQMVIDFSLLLYRYSFFNDCAPLLTKVKLIPNCPAKPKSSILTIVLMVSIR